MNKRPRNKGENRRRWKKNFGPGGVPNKPNWQRDPDEFFMDSARQEAERAERAKRRASNVQDYMEFGLDLDMANTFARRFGSVDVLARGIAEGRLDAGTVNDILGLGRTKAGNPRRVVQNFFKSVQPRVHHFQAQMAADAARKEAEDQRWGEINDRKESFSIVTGRGVRGEVLRPTDALNTPEADRTEAQQAQISSYIGSQLEVARRTRGVRVERPGVGGARESAALKWVDPNDLKINEEQTLRQSIEQQIKDFNKSQQTGDNAWTAEVLNTTTDNQGRPTIQVRYTDTRFNRSYTYQVRAVENQFAQSERDRYIYFVANKATGEGRAYMINPEVQIEQVGKDSGDIKSIRVRSPEQILSTLFRSERVTGSLSERGFSNYSLYGMRAQQFVKAATSLVVPSKKFIPRDKDDPNSKAREVDIYSADLVQIAALADQVYPADDGLPRSVRGNTIFSGGALAGVTYGEGEGGELAGPENPKRIQLGGVRDRAEDYLNNLARMEDSPANIRMWNVPHEPHARRPIRHFLGGWGLPEGQGYMRQGESYAVTHRAITVQRDVIEKNTLQVGDTWTFNGYKPASLAEGTRLREGQDVPGVIRFDPKNNYMATIQKITYGEDDTATIQFAMIAPAEESEFKGGGLKIMTGPAGETNPYLAGSDPFSIAYRLGGEKDWGYIATTAFMETVDADEAFKMLARQARSEGYSASQINSLFQLGEDGLTIQKGGVMMAQEVAYDWFMSQFKPVEMKNVAMPEWMLENVAKRYRRGEDDTRPWQEVLADTPFNVRNVRQATHKRTGEVVEGMVLVDYTDQMAETYMPSTLLPLTSRPVLDLGIEQLNVLQWNEPEIYNQLVQRSDRGDIANPARDIVASARANMGGAGLRAAQGIRERMNLLDLSDASSAAVSDFYNTFNTLLRDALAERGIEEGEQAGVEYDQALDAVFRQMASMEEYRGVNLQIQGLVLPTLDTLSRGLVVSENGLVPNYAMLGLRAIMQEGEIHAAPGLDPTVHERQADTLETFAIKLAEESQNEGVLKAAGGVSIEASSGAARGGPLPLGTVVYDRAEFARLIRSYDDDTLRVFTGLGQDATRAEMMKAAFQKYKSGQFDVITTMYPHANQANAFLRSQGWSLEYAQQVEGLDWLRTSHRNVVVSSDIAASHIKDFDADRISAFIDPTGRVQRRSPQEILRTMFGNVGGEADTMIDRMARTIDDIQARRNWASLSQSDIEKMRTNRQKVREGYAGEVASKSVAGLVYHPWIIAATGSVRNMIERSDLRNTEIGNRIYEQISSIAQAAYQFSIDMAENADPAQQFLNRVTRNLVLDAGWRRKGVNGATWSDSVAAAFLPGPGQERFERLKNHRQFGTVVGPQGIANMVMPEMVRLGMYMKGAEGEDRIKSAQAYEGVIDYSVGMFMRQDWMRDKDRVEAAKNYLRDLQADPTKKVTNEDFERYFGLSFIEAMFGPKEGDPNKIQPILPRTVARQILGNTLNYHRRKNSGKYEDESWFDKFPNAAHAFSEAIAGSIEAQASNIKKARGGLEETLRRAVGFLDDRVRAGFPATARLATLFGETTAPDVDVAQATKEGLQENPLRSRTEVGRLNRLLGEPTDAHREAVREDAIRWAQDILNEDFVVLDTETTGRDRSTDQVIQLSIIDKEGNTLFHSLLRPTIGIEPGASDVHDITDDAVQDPNVPTIADVWDKLEPLLSGNILAYNAPFDMDVLRNTLEAYGLQMPESANWIDVMRPYGRYRGEQDPKGRGYKWFKLSEAAAAEELPTEGAHDALADTRMTLGVLKRMARQALGKLFGDEDVPQQREDPDRYGPPPARQPQVTPRETPQETKPDQATEPAREPFSEQPVRKPPQAPAQPAQVPEGHPYTSGLGEPQSSQPTPAAPPQVPERATVRASSLKQRREDAYRTAMAIALMGDVDSEEAVRGDLLHNEIAKILENPDEVERYFGKGAKVAELNGQPLLEQRLPEYSVGKNEAGTEMFISGQPDAVIQLPDGSLFLLDWKSGTMRGEAYTGQLQGYTAGLEEAGVSVSGGAVVNADDVRVQEALKRGDFSGAARLMLESASAGIQSPLQAPGNFFGFSRERLHDRSGLNRMASMAIRAQRHASNVMSTAAGKASAAAVQAIGTFGNAIHSARQLLRTHPAPPDNTPMVPSAGRGPGEPVSAGGVTGGPGGPGGSKPPEPPQDFGGGSEPPEPPQDFGGGSGAQPPSGQPFMGGIPVGPDGRPLALWAGVDEETGGIVHAWREEPKEMRPLRPSDIGGGARVLLPGVDDRDDRQPAVLVDKDGNVINPARQDKYRREGINQTLGVVGAIQDEVNRLSPQGLALENLNLTVQLSQQLPREVAPDAAAEAIRDFREIAGLYDEITNSFSMIEDATAPISADPQGDPDAYLAEVSRQAGMRQQIQDKFGVDISDLSADEAKQAVFNAVVGRHGGAKDLRARLRKAMDTLGRVSSRVSVVESGDLGNTGISPDEASIKMFQEAFGDVGAFNRERYGKFGADSFWHQGIDKASRWQKVDPITDSDNLAVDTAVNRLGKLNEALINLSDTLPKVIDGTARLTAEQVANQRSLSTIGELLESVDAKIQVAETVAEKTQTPLPQEVVRAKEALTSVGWYDQGGDGTSLRERLQSVRVAEGLRRMGMLDTEREDAFTPFGRRGTGFYYGLLAMRGLWGMTSGQAMQEMVGAEPFSAQVSAIEGRPSILRARMAARENRELQMGLAASDSYGWLEDLANDVLGSHPGARMAQDTRFATNVAGQTLSLAGMLFQSGIMKEAGTAAIGKAGLIGALAYLGVGAFREFVNAATGEEYDTLGALQYGGAFLVDTAGAVIGAVEALFGGDGSAGARVGRIASNLYPSKPSEDLSKGLRFEQEMLDWARPWEKKGIPAGDVVSLTRQIQSIAGEDYNIDAVYQDAWVKSLEAQTHAADGRPVLYQSELLGEGDFYFHKGFDFHYNKELERVMLGGTFQNPEVESLERAYELAESGLNPDEVYETLIDEGVDETLARIHLQNIFQPYEKGVFGPETPEASEAQKWRSLPLIGEVLGSVAERGQEVVQVASESASFALGAEPTDADRRLGLFKRYALADIPGRHSLKRGESLWSGEFQELYSRLGREDYGEVQDELLTADHTDESFGKARATVSFMLPMLRAGVNIGYGAAYTYAHQMSMDEAQRGGQVGAEAAYYGFGDMTAAWLGSRQGKGAQVAQVSQMVTQVYGEYGLGGIVSFSTLVERSHSPVYALVNMGQTPQQVQGFLNWGARAAEYNDPTVLLELPMDSQHDYWKSPAAVRDQIAELYLNDPEYTPRDFDSMVQKLAEYSRAMTAAGPQYDDIAYSIMREAQAQRVSPYASMDEMISEITSGRKSLSEIAQLERALRVGGIIPDESDRAKYWRGAIEFANRARDPRLMMLYGSNIEAMLGRDVDVASAMRAADMAGAAGLMSSSAFGTYFGFATDRLGMQGGAAAEWAARQAGTASQPLQVSRFTGVASSLLDRGVAPTAAISVSTSMAMMSPQDFGIAQRQMQGIFQNDPLSWSLFYERAGEGVISLLQQQTGMPSFIPAVNTTTGQHAWQFHIPQSGWEAIQAFAEHTGQSHLIAGLSFDPGNFGLQGIENQLRDYQRRAQGAGVGVALQNLELNKRFMMGGATGVDAQGFALGGDGMAAYNQYAQQLGLPTTTRATMGMWQIQDAFTRLQREQQSFQLDMEGRALALSRQEFTLAGKQFYERMAQQREQFEYNTQFTREGMNIARERQLTQRVWGQEDLDYARDMSELQFGWQMEDLDRNIRYARGRERQDLLRQQGRAVIQFSMQQGKMDRDQERFDERARWEDEDFERQKKHHEQLVQFQEEAMDLQVKHFEEGRELQEKRLAMQEEAHQKQIAWMQETWALEDEKRLAEREHWMNQQEMQRRSIAASMAYAKEMWALQDLLRIISEMFTAQGLELETWVAKFGELPPEAQALFLEMVTGIDKSKTELQHMFNQMIYWADLVKGKFQTPVTVYEEGEDLVYGERLVTENAIGGVAGHWMQLGAPKPSGFNAIEALPGFALGGEVRGYTGSGFKYQAAGIVHGGEYVVPQEGALVLRGGNQDVVVQLEKIVDLLERIVHMGPGRVNATIYTNSPSVKTSDFTPRDRAYQTF